jgi:hypothetical protein
MMKASIILLVALAVSVNGLGFPNFNLGCPLAQANRFSTAEIPYCTVNDLGLFNELLTSLARARPGYTPVFEPRNNWVLINPTLSKNEMNRVSTGNYIFPGVLAAVSEEARMEFGTHIAVGAEVGFNFDDCESFGLGTVLESFASAVGGVGLTSLVACRASDVYGTYEFSNTAGGSIAGRSQQYTIPRPYIFYGL